MDERLRPSERIRKRTEFIDLYRKGCRIKGKYFHLVYQPNELGISRLGVVVSKKIGKATVRNRIKRWFREVFRRNKELLARPVDLVLIAQKDILELDWEKLVKEYRQTIKKIAN
ncbi:MAG: ribonuclease P protein component [Candidatus Aminicenantes bacterium]|nr:ribonuclease P protein component [Candidatus Aminicenantes bacterium]